MWQELIVKERTETALEEGLTAQAVSRERRCEYKQHSLLDKAERMISQPSHKESSEDQIAIVLVKQQI